MIFSGIYKLNGHPCTQKSPKGNGDIFAMADSQIFKFLKSPPPNSENCPIIGFTKSRVGPNSIAKLLILNLLSKRKGRRIIWACPDIRTTKTTASFGLSTQTIRANIFCREDIFCPKDNGLSPPKEHDTIYINRFRSHKLPWVTSKLTRPHVVSTAKKKGDLNLQDRDKQISNSTCQTWLPQKRLAEEIRKKLLWHSLANT